MWFHISYLSDQCQYRWCWAPQANHQWPHRGVQSCRRSLDLYTRRWQSVHQVDPTFSRLIERGWIVRSRSSHRTGQTLLCFRIRRANGQLPGPPSAVYRRWLRGSHYDEDVLPAMNRYHPVMCQCTHGDLKSITRRTVAPVTMATLCSFFEIRTIMQHFLPQEFLKPMLGKMSPYARRKIRSYHPSG